MFIKFLILILCVGLISCSPDYKAANKRSVEKLRLKLLEGDFESIYIRSAGVYISKEEFVENMKAAVKRMKDFDELLNWQQDEAADDRKVREFASYESESWRTMEKDGKKLSITIYWSAGFSFCDLTIFEESNPNEPEMVVTGCSKT